MFSAEERQIVSSDSITLVLMMKSTQPEDHPRIISEYFSGYPEHLKREIMKDAYHDYYEMKE